MSNYKHQKHTDRGTGRHSAPASAARAVGRSSAPAAAAPVARLTLREILLVAAVLILSIGCFTTIAYMRATGGELSNSFFGANVYKLEYNANAQDASGTVKDDKEITASSVAEYEFTLKENGFTREGYVFQGWDFNSSAEIPSFVPGDTVKLEIGDPSRIIYAIWKAENGFKLNYDLNFSGAPAMQSQTHTGGEESHSFTAAALPEGVSNPGFVFAGWSFDSKATAASYQAGDSVSVSKSEKERTLYAVWAIDTEYIQYSVSFDLNLPKGISSSNVTAPKTMKASDKALSHVFTLSAEPQVKDFESSGLVFAGWATESDGAAMYGTGSSVTVNYEDKVQGELKVASLTLYATWTWEYYVSFESTVTDPAAVLYSRENSQPTGGSGPILVSTRSNHVNTMGFYESADEYYKRQGYVLVGFSENASDRIGQENITLSTPGKANAKTVYAIWTVGSYALIYDANGGSNAPAADTWNGTAVTHSFNILHGGVVPSAGAYDAVFLGWSTDPDALAPEYVYSNGSFTPSSLTLTEDEPTETLYAVWNYHYVLTYDKGYGNEGTLLPVGSEAWSTAKSYDFAVEAGPDPERYGYAFMYFWSDTLDRQNNENRYHKPGQGEGLRTNITVYADNTHKSVYPRFSPVGSVYLYFDMNGGSESGAPEAINLSKTNSWKPGVSVAPGTYSPSIGRSGYTFVGWAEDPNADYSWLESTDESRMIYGGVSGNNTYYLNTDQSKEHYLYAVWAPDHTVRITVNYNGGAGWYQTTTKPDCDYVWDSRQNVSSRSFSYTLSFSQYWNRSTYTCTLGASSGSKTGATNGSVLLMPVKEGAALRGFLLGGTDRVYYPTTVSSGHTGSGNGQNDYRSSGAIQLQNVTVDIGKADPSVTSYSFTLYAQWGATVDWYQVVLVNSDGSTTLLAEASENINDSGYTEHTFPAMTLKTPDSLVRTGYVTDYATSPGGPVVYTVAPDYTGQDDNHSAILQWSGNYEDWYIDSDITLNCENTAGLEETQNGDGANVYTLKLYPVESKGEVYALTVNNDSRRPMKVLAYATLGRTYNNLSSHTIYATARAGSGTYTWPAGEAGRFTGVDYSDSSIEGASPYSYYTYQFLGYSESGYDGNVDYTVSRSGHERYYSMGYRTQYYHRINQSVTIDSKASNVSPGSYAEGIPMYTMNIYAVCAEYKDFVVQFNANGGTWSGSTTSFSSRRNYTSDVYKDFEAGKSLSMPTRDGYEFLGFNYLKTDPVDSPVAPDIPVTVVDEDTVKTGVVLTVRDEDAREGSGKDVVVSTSSAPDSTTMTVYALWLRRQEFKLLLYGNDGTTGDDFEFSEVTEPGLKEYSFTVTPSKTPAYGDYTFLGYSYEKIAAGQGTIEDVDVAVNEDGTLGPIRLTKADHELGLSPGTVTTTDDGADTTTMTLYAVWAAEMTYYQISISSEGTTRTYFRYADQTNGPEHTFTTTTVPSVNNLSTLAASREGYRLAGLRYAGSEELLCTVSGNRLGGDVTVAQGGTDVTPSTYNNADCYTLNLEAVWIKQTLFRVQIAPNKGALMASNSYDLTEDVRVLTLSNGSDVMGFDETESRVTIPSGYYVTYTSNSNSSGYVLAQRTDHRFMGVDNDENYVTGTPDYTVSQSYTSSQYRQTVKNIVIDLNDAQMDIAKGVYEDDPDVTLYTLTLYAAWEPYQYFEVELLPNGGAFHDSAGNAVESHVTRSDRAEYGVQSMGIAASYTDANPNRLIRPGYKLMGYSYTPGGGVDVTISSGAGDDSTKVTLNSVTVTKGDSSREQLSYSFESGGSQIGVTRLKLYAVWGTRLDYVSLAGGTVPAPVIRTEPDATNLRTVDIAAVRPVNKNFIFLGWSVHYGGGEAEYGVDGYYEKLREEPLKSSITFDETTGHISLYAVWTQRFELYYNANGGDDATLPEPEFTYVNTADTYFPVSAKIPVREGYTFLGWAETADATVPKYTADTGDAYDDAVKVTGKTDGSTTGVTIYAVWQANGSTSSDEGGEAEPAEASVTPTPTAPAGGAPDVTGTDPVAPASLEPTAPTAEDGQGGQPEGGENGEDTAQADPGSPEGAGGDPA